MHYYKNIQQLLAGLKTVTPLSDQFHIHKFEDTPSTWIAETAIFRSNTYSIILLLEGNAYYKIGLLDYHIQQHSLYFMAPQHLRYYKRLSDWKGYVLVFTNDFLSNHPPLLDIVSHFEGFSTFSKAVLQLSEQAVQQSQQLFSWLHQIAYSNSPSRWAQSKALLELLLLKASQWHQEQYPQETSLKGTQRLVEGFNQLLEQHLYELTQGYSKEQTNVAALAQALAVHPSYLGEVIKEHTGSTPKTLISERFVLEAQALLHHTDATVAAVADRLQFSDASNFSKFFKHQTGLSPSQYRKKLQKIA